MQIGSDPPHASLIPAVKAHLKDSYEVIIVGAGISGMAAAQAASKEGADVLIVDEYPQPGGHSFGYQNDERLAQKRIQLSLKLAGEDSITFSPETTACGFYPPDTLLLNMGGYLKRVSSRAFVFAAGCSDCIPTFENNDMPGIFGARAVRVLLERHDLVPGKRAVLYGTGEDLENLANLLDYRGIKTILSASPSEDELNANASTGPVMRPARLTAARGGSWVKHAVITSSNKRARRIETACDLICTAFRGQPSYELPYQAGFSFELSGGSAEENRVMIPVSTERENDGGVSFHLTGELAGVLKWESKIAHGAAAGNKAAERAASNI